MGYYARRELSDHDWKTQIAKKYPNIPRGSKVELMRHVDNLYGSFVRVRWNGNIYDVHMYDLEYMEE